MIKYRKKIEDVEVYTYDEVVDYYERFKNIMFKPDSWCFFNQGISICKDTGIYCIVKNNVPQLMDSNDVLIIDSKGDPHVNTIHNLNRLYEPISEV